MTRTVSLESLRGEGAPDRRASVQPARDWLRAAPPGSTRRLGGSIRKLPWHRAPTEGAGEPQVAWGMELRHEARKGHRWSGSFLLGPVKPGPRGSASDLKSEGLRPVRVRGPASPPSVTTVDTSHPPSHHVSPPGRSRALTATSPRARASSSTSGRSACPGTRAGKYQVSPGWNTVPRGRSSRSGRMLTTPSPSGSVWPCGHGRLPGAWGTARMRGGRVPGSAAVGWPPGGELPARIAPVPSNRPHIEGVPLER